MTQTALYRHFDANGQLLYVGISLSAVGRLAQHRDKEWFTAIATMTTEWFRSRDEAIFAEQAAIRDELPAYNRMRFGAPTVALPVLAKAIIPDENRISQRHYDQAKSRLDKKGPNCCFCIDIASGILRVPTEDLDALVEVPVGHIPRIKIAEMYVLLGRLRAGPKRNDKPIQLEAHAGLSAHSGKGPWGAQLPNDEWLVRRPTTPAAQLPTEGGSR